MPNVAPLPDLVLYARPECSLCDEARQAIDLVIADRRERGLAVPTVIERNIEADPGCSGHCRADPGRRDR